MASKLAVQLQSMLAALDQVDAMVAEFEKTGDKKLHNAITNEMRAITPQLKVLSSNQECRTKENLQKLVEVSNRVKSTVDKTNNISARSNSSSSVDSRSMPGTSVPAALKVLLSLSTTSPYSFLDTLKLDGFLA